MKCQWFFSKSFKKIVSLNKKLKLKYFLIHDSVADFFNSRKVKEISWHLSDLWFSEGKTSALWQIRVYLEYPRLHDREIDK